VASVLHQEGVDTKMRLFNLFELAGSPVFSDIVQSLKMKGLSAPEGQLLEQHFCRLKSSL
jgi:hypothetical protein